MPPWHPDSHAIVLEGGFDRHVRFFFFPLGANKALTEIWRRGVIALFLYKGLLNRDFARKLLSWRHSGFSIESGTRIYDQKAREALSQYISSCPAFMTNETRDAAPNFLWTAIVGMRNRLIHGHFDVDQTLSGRR